MLRTKRALNRRWASWVIAVAVGGALALAEDLLADATAGPHAGIESSAAVR